MYHILQAVMACDIPYIRQTKDVINWIEGDIDTKLAGFSMNKARASAWEFAKCLVPLKEDAQQQDIRKADFVVEKFGQLGTVAEIIGKLR